MPKSELSARRKNLLYGVTNNWSMMLQQEQ